MTETLRSNTMISYTALLISNLAAAFDPPAPTDQALPVYLECLTAIRQVQNHLLRSDIPSDKIIGQAIQTILDRGIASTIPLETYQRLLNKRPEGT